MFENLYKKIIIKNSFFLDKKFKNTTIHIYNSIEYKIFQKNDNLIK